jgi:hypothetical protein
MLCKRAIKEEDSYGYPDFYEFIKEQGGMSNEHTNNEKVRKIRV